MRTFLFSILFLSLIQSLIYCSEEKESFFGTVLHLEGEVFITRGMMDFDAKIEDRLMYGDEIETGENAKIQLSFQSSYLSIGPSTLISLNEKLEPIEQTTEATLARNTILTLEQGGFRTKIINAPQTEIFTVKTDLGELRVQGTDFVTRFQPSSDQNDLNQMKCEVLEGSVALKAFKAPPQSQLPAQLTLNQNQIGGFLPNSDKFSEPPFGPTKTIELQEEFPLPGDKKPSLVFSMKDLNEVDTKQLLSLFPMVDGIFVDPRDNDFSPENLTQLEETKEELNEEVLTEIIDQEPKVEEQSGFKIEFTIEAGEN